jgi:hypothetical protein
MAYTQDSPTAYRTPLSPSCAKSNKFKNAKSLPPVIVLYLAEGLGSFVYIGVFVPVRISMNCGVDGRCRLNIL